MALRWGDRILETSSTTGTGAFALAAAVTGYRRFSAIPSINTSDTVYYSIFAVDGNGNPSGDWETGLGTYSAANELTRTTPMASTNGGAAVNFAAGTKYVMCSPVAGIQPSAFIITLLDDADASTARTTLGAAASGANTDITALDQDITVTATGTIAADTIGYRGLPTSSQSTGSAITLGLADAGKRVPNTSGGWAIPANGTTAFPVGTTIVLYNDSGSTQTVTITTDTLRLGGTTSTGTRTIAVRGLATLVKVASTEWVITGHVT
jgi:hypothetical protein